MTHSSSLLTTGIPALDRVMGGGIPPRQVHLVAGQPGSGKTILAGQVAFAQAARGAPVLLATAASEPHTKVLETLQRFSFFERERVGREIFLLSIYPWLRKGVRETREMILSSVREQRAQLLVIDGLRSLRDVWRDEAHIREFLSELGVGLATSDCTGVLTLEASPDRILETPEAATVDGVITLPFDRVGMRRERRLEVVKVRGHRHLRGEHAVRLGHDGYEIFVRCEAEAEAAVPQRASAGTAPQAPFGDPVVDAWLGGGIPAAGVTLIHGAHGTGKSLLASLFAGAGGKDGALLASLGEPAESMVARASAMGLRTEGVRPFSPEVLELLPDQVAHGLLQRSVEVGRVVLDGAEPLWDAVAPDRRHDFTRALLRRLSAGGRAVLVTAEGAKGLLSELSDNILELAVVRPGEVWEVRPHKIRAAALPKGPLRFRIGPRGIEEAEG